jgi:hypothetical protein
MTPSDAELFRAGELVVSAQQIFGDGCIGGEPRRLVLEVDGARSEFALGRFVSDVVDEWQSVEHGGALECVGVDVSIFWRAVRVAA